MYLNNLDCWQKWGAVEEQEEHCYDERLTTFSDGTPFIRSRSLDNHVECVPLE